MHKKTGIKIEAIIETASAFHLDLRKIIPYQSEFARFSNHTQKHLRELIKFRCYQLICIN